MFKFTVRILLVASLFLSNVSNATIMFVSYANGGENGEGKGVSTEDVLTEDLLGINFFEFEDFDWAWASPVNTQEWNENELNPAEAIENWTEATDEQLQSFRDFVTSLLTEDLQITEDFLDFFTYEDEDGNTAYINAVEYWNSVFKTPAIDTSEDAEVNVNDLLTGQIATYLDQYGESGYDTFYVRAIEDRPSAVPEPATILIFALALIALSFRNRFAK